MAAGEGITRRPGRCPQHDHRGARKRMRPCPRDIDARRSSLKGKAPSHRDACDARQLVFPSHGWHPAAFTVLARGESTMTRLVLLVGLVAALSSLACGGGKGGTVTTGTGGDVAKGTGGAPSGSGEGGASGCTTGNERCACYANGTCNAGLTCASQICVALGGGTGGSANTGTGGNAGTGTGGNTGTGTGGN